MPPAVVANAQQAESDARTKAGIDPGENAHALDVVDDVGGAPDPGPAPRVPQDDAAPLPPARSRFDQRRDEIVARYRTERTVEADADRDDISDFARSGLPPDFDPQPEPEPESQPEPQPQPGPQTVRVKVHGQEMDLPLEDVIAKAQIALASENLLDETKSRLKEVDSLLAATRANVARADQPGQHQARPQSTQTTEPALDPGADPEHHEDALAKLIETLQFGDPAEARQLLQNTIAESSTKAVQEQLLIQRVRDEGARSAKVLKDFMTSHADLAKDPMAQAAIERQVYDLQIEDLKAIGFDPANIQTPSGVVTPADIADAHRYYRANGYEIRKPEALLEAATASFLTWKGVKTDLPNPADPAPKAPPRIEVSVDRTARRSAIPQQPARTAVPRQDPQQATPQPRDRSAIVQQEIARRNLPRRRVVA